MTKYSIVIPAYNSGPFLAKTIQSALAQDVDGYEIIVVDDGSTDNSFDVASSFDGILAIKQDNAGDSAARNTGLARATGDFVLFLDHDDVLHPTAISLHSSAFEDNPEIDMVFGSNLQISETDKVLGENRQPVRQFSGRDVAMNTTPSFSQCMYRKSALDRIGGFRPEALNCADHDLNIRLLGDRLAGFCHGELVMSYRKHQGQQTRSPSKLYTNHARVLRRHFGPGGFLEDADYLSRILKRWKSHYGQAMPGEVVRLLRQARLDDAIRCFGVFLRAQPYSGLGALRYLPRRFAQSFT
ncbi:glycosyltransferase family A protein [Roseovarius tolerans]|uniref:glycosyltransferase family A protein n=1 Tax=Roseovarius tolerans TaxID=74031 RepID=UPI00237DF373|nr:glycosyltransferase family A protein [Roseovarius tolerans]